MEYFSSRRTLAHVGFRACACMEVFLWLGSANTTLQPGEESRDQCPPPPLVPHSSTLPLPIVGSRLCFSFMEIPLLYCNLLVLMTWRRRRWAFELVTALPSGTLCVLAHNSSVDSPQLSATQTPRNCEWDPKEEMVSGTLAHSMGRVAQQGGGPNNFLPSSKNLTTCTQHAASPGQSVTLGCECEDPLWVCISGGKNSKLIL